MVEATAPADEFEDCFKAAMDTKVDYPDFVKKVVDIGENYVNYAIYEVSEDKVSEAIKIVTARYHAITMQVPNYQYLVKVALSMEDWVQTLK